LTALPLSSPPPRLRPTLAGLVTAGIYLLFVLLYPLPVYGQADRPFDLEILSRSRPWAALLYVFGLLLLFALFWRALRTVEKDTVPWRWVVGFGMLFALILVWLYPVTATDLFQYVLRARVRVVHGANPMTVPPSAFPDDPLLPFAGEWTGIVSPYGPAWELLAEGLAWLGARGAVSGALAYKGVALLAYLACTALVAWGARGDAQSVLFFAWNPLVLLEGVGNGHNDLLMLVGGVGAVLLWQRKGRWPIAVAAMSLAVLTKFSVALLAPLLLLAILRDQHGWRPRLKVLLGGGLLAAGLVVLLYLPFWPPWESIAGLLDEFSNRYTYTVAAMLRLLLREFIPNHLALEIPRRLGQAVFVGVYIWILVRLWRRRMDLAEASVLAFFTYLLTSTNYRIWYPLWLVPFAALSLTERTRLRVFLFCLTSELSILMFYLVWRWLLNGYVLPEATWLTMHLLTVPWQFGLPLLAPLLLTSPSNRAKL